MKLEPAVCEVCYRLDSDRRVKLCSYCSLCDAWICQADITRLDRRARAALDKKVFQNNVRPSFYS